MPFRCDNKAETMVSKMITADIDDMMSVDEMVLSFISRSSLKGTRLQKLSMLYSAITENETEVVHNAYYFGAYSDDVSESASKLIDYGMISKSGGQYSITEYGNNIVSYLLNNNKKFATNYESIGNLVDMLGNINDKDLVCLTYAFYPDLAENSVIKSDIERRNENKLLCNKRVKMMDRNEFESLLKKDSKIELS